MSMKPSCRSVDAGRKMDRSALLVAVCLLAGCDSESMKALGLLPASERNLVVLSDQPVLLTEEGRSFASPDSMKFLGEWTSLCLSLKGAVPLRDSVAMDRSFKEAMGDAKVTAHLTLSDGTRVALRKPLQAWRKYGVVAGQDELSACAAMPCGGPLPRGAQITRVEISSAPPLHVRGVFWSSERGPLESPVPPSEDVRTSRPQVSSTCRA